MRAHLSIRARVALGSALLATLTGVIAVVVVLSVTSSQLRARAKASDRQNQIAAQMRPSGPSGPAANLPGPAANPLGLPPPDKPTGTQPRTLRRNVDGQNAEEAIRSSRQVGLLVVGGLAGFAILGSFLLAGRLLRPIKVMSATARTVAAPGSGSRIPLSPLAPGARGDELHQLGVTINSMLERIDQSSQMQRQFVADASHELRTPLTVLRNEVDVALDNPEPTVASYAESLMRTRSELSQMSSLVESLLHLSKANTLSVREPSDLANSAEGAIAVCKRLGIGDRRFEMDLASAPVFGDPVLLDRCVLNLVENACLYNNHQGLVRVSTYTNADRSFIVVTNDGPNVENAERLFDRFARGANHRLRGDGHGLGLAIVRTVVESHGGLVTARPRSGGGLVVEASFPRDGR
jgi:signal transduction histidine kinase